MMRNVLESAQLTASTPFPGGSNICTTSNFGFPFDEPRFALPSLYSDPDIDLRDMILVLGPRSPGSRQPRWLWLTFCSNNFDKFVPYRGSKQPSSRIVYSDPLKMIN